jgi:hypothetical protein
VLSLLASLPPHRHGPPPATRLRMLALGCPPQAPPPQAEDPPQPPSVVKSEDQGPPGQAPRAHASSARSSPARASSAQAPAPPPPTPPPRRRGVLWGCTVSFSRYASPTFAAEDLAVWQKDRCPPHGIRRPGQPDAEAINTPEAASKHSHRAPLAAEEDFHRAVLRGGPLPATPPGMLTPSGAAAFAYASELLRRTNCRLAAAHAGPPVGIPDVLFELPSEAQRALCTARLELYAVPIAAQELGTALVAAAVYHTPSAAVDAPAVLAAAGEGGETQAVGLLCGWLLAHSAPAVRAAALQYAIEELCDCIREPAALSTTAPHVTSATANSPMPPLPHPPASSPMPDPCFSTADNSMPSPPPLPTAGAPPSATAIADASALRSRVLFLLDGLWRASSPLTAGAEAAALVAKLEAAEARPVTTGPVGGSLGGSPPAGMMHASGHAPADLPSAAANAAWALPLPIPSALPSALPSTLSSALRLAHHLALTACAPVLERLADATAAPLAGAGVKLTSSAKGRYAARAAAGSQALIAALRRLRDATPDPPQLLEHIITHLNLSSAGRGVSR